jgi:uncharacterized protein YjiS (DUF1127 family)
MERSLGNSLSVLAVPHLEALTAVSRSPALRSPSVAFRWRANEERPLFAGGQWLRSPAIVMRGGEPRETESQRRPSWLASVGHAVVAVVDRILDWQERTRSRRQLLTLNDRALQDIGLDRARADHEASLPFWRAR